MREPGEVVMAGIPRPGRALKGVLATIAVLAIAGAVFVNWGPKPVGDFIRQWLWLHPSEVLRHPWALLTSGLFTSPFGIGHALFSLVGLYFLTPDLERRWGGKRLLRFLLTSVLVGNLLVLAVGFIPIQRPVFRPDIVIGPTAAIVAIAIAWSKENWHGQMRFMMFLPMSGKILFWITLGLSALAILFLQDMPEGAVAPLGGALAGIVFGGTPSPVARLFGRFRPDATNVELSHMPASEKPRSSKRAGKAPLRVVVGGLEEDLKNRKPPKDKRYLN